MGKVKKESLTSSMQSITDLTEIISISTNPPENIAYKIASSKFLAVIYEDPISNKVIKKDLIALQLKFSNSDELGKLIEIYRVYFERKTKTIGTTEIEYFEFTKEDTPCIILNDPSEVYYINEYKKGSHASSSLFDLTLPNLKTSHYELKQEPEENIAISICTKLDFYNEQVGYIYFSVDQLIPLVEFYEFLIFSGCQLKLGKKLSHNPNEIKLYEELIFSLKVEGQKLKNGYGFSAQRDSTTEAPASHTGYPCPPVWRTIAFIAGLGLRLKPEAAKDQKTMLKAIRSLVNLDIF